MRAEVPSRIDERSTQCLMATCGQGCRLSNNRSALVVEGALARWRSTTDAALWPEVAATYRATLRLWERFRCDPRVPLPWSHACCGTPQESTSTCRSNLTSKPSGLGVREPTRETRVETLATFRPVSAGDDLPRIEY